MVEDRPVKVFCACLLRAEVFEGKHMVNVRGGCCQVPDHLPAGHGDTCGWEDRLQGLEERLVIDKGPYAIHTVEEDRTHILIPQSEFFPDFLKNLFFEIIFYATVMLFQQLLNTAFFQKIFPGHGEKSDLFFQFLFL